MRKTLDHAAEQRRRYLEVEDGRVLAFDRAGHALIGLRVGEVARHHRQACGEPGEHLFVDRFARGLDRAARVVDQGRFRPVVEGDPDDRTVEQTAALEPIQRAERHLSGQIACDPKDHKYVGRCGGGRRHVPI